MSLLSEMQADSPWGLWMEDEASGNLADQSGNSRTLTVTGTPTAYQAQSTGLLKGVSWPAATTAHADSSANTGTGVASHTTEVWLYYSATPGANTSIFAVANGTTNYTELMLLTSGAVRFSCRQSGSSTFKDSAVLSTGTWHHLVGTNNAGTMKIRYDKTNSSTSSKSCTNGTAVAKIHGAPNSAANAFITGPAAYYETALSDARIDVHYNQGAGIFSGDASGAHTQSATADGVLGKVGDATGAHTQSATADGVLGKVGDATGAHTQGASADGVIGVSATATGAHTQGATAAGATGIAGDATGAHTQGATADGTVVAGFAGAATGAHTQGATADGVVAVFGDATGAHTQGATAIGSVVRTGDASATHTQGATATGSTGLSGDATGAHTQGATASGAATGATTGGAHTQGATAAGTVHTGGFEGDAIGAHTQAATATGAVGEGDHREGTPLTAEHTQSASATGVVVITLPSTTAGTVRWLFYDPLSADSYTFAINPDSMTSPEPPQKQVRTGPGRTQHSDPPGTQPRAVTFMTKPAPWEWEFSGAIREQAQYTALRDWVARGTAVMVRDHLSRVWKVYLTDFLPAEYPKASRIFWRIRYTVKVQILRRVS